MATSARDVYVGGPDPAQRPLGARWSPAQRSIVGGVIAGALLWMLVGVSLWWWDPSAFSQ